MQKNKFKSIKTELLLIVVITITIAVVFNIAYTSWSQNHYEITATENEAKRLAREYTNTIEKHMERPQTAAKILAQTLAAIKNENKTLSIKRDDLTAMLNNILVQNTDFQGVFSLWEKNAFDENDENMFDATNVQGRMATYVYRSNSGLINTTNLKSFLQKSIPDYYMLPKKQMTEVITNPFIFPAQEQNDSVVAFVAPISHKKFFLGVVGINIKTNHFQNLLKEAKLIDGHAKIALLANNGTYVANTLNDTLIGKNIEQQYDNETYNEILSVIQNGYTQAFYTQNHYQINVPLIISENNAPWQLQIHIPISTIKKDAQNTIYKIFISGFFIIAIITLIIYLYLNRLFSPVNKTVEMVNALAIGDLRINSDINYNNEIGLISNAIEQLAQSLRNLTRISNAIAEGDFSQRVQPNSENDELAYAINKMNENLKKAEEENEYRRSEAALRNWMSQGIAELGELLRRTTDNIEELAIEILQKIVNHLNATQAGLFIIDNTDPDNTYLELVGAFAYDRKRFFESKIMLGEGLVGTCAKERETIYLEKIPDDYIKLSSGLGESKPRSLLIVPLKMESNTLGIIELSSFNKFKKHEIEFVERAAESMALTISTIKVNERTAKLLDQSRKQAEELALQDKEMRQNLQELKHTQEESLKREAEMRGVLKALNLSSLVAEYDVTGKLLGINEGFTKLFGMKRDQIIGKTITELGFIDENREDFAQVWEDLRLGKNIKSREENVRFPNGDEFWLSQTFTPILDEQGNPYKILVVAMDITRRKKQELELLKISDLLTKQKAIFIAKNEEYTALLKAIDHAFIAGDFAPDGSMLRSNENFRKIIVDSTNENTNQNLFDIIYGVEKKRFMKMWKGLLSGKSFDLIFEHKNKKGETTWIKASYVPAINSKDEVNKIFFVGLDISEYHRAEIEMTQRIEELENILNEKNTTKL